MLSSERLLLVVAHPDDEVLMAGGTMAIARSRGAEVAVLFMADGCTSRDAVPNIAVEAKRRAAKRANAALGVKAAYFEKFPDNRMDDSTRLEVAKAIEYYIDMAKPTIVITHHGSDVNIDHRVVNDAVIIACRPQPGCTVKRLLFGEVPSSTEYQAPGRVAFQPTYFVDVTRAMPKKMKALGHYAGEMRPWPHARSMRGVEALARWRGASVGVQAAEAFVLAREIA